MNNRKNLIAVAITFLLIFAGYLVKWEQNQKFNNLRGFYSQKIKWESCYQNFFCGSFRVPINYDDPGTGYFTLQAIKHVASDNSNRLGALLVNPGGPGGSAYDYAMSADAIVSNALYKTFDIVGFDGRGIGESEPIRCLTDKEEDAFINIDGTNSSQSTLIAAAKTFADSCKKVAGLKIGHVSTFETAKDMDILRALLHEKKLNYLGKSYGTYLGAIYISLFPATVGKFVLDGAVDPNISIRDQSLNQTAGFEKSLDDFLSANSTFKKADIQNLIERAGIKPLKDKKRRALNRSLLITAIAASLYDNGLGWANLKLGLSNALSKSDPSHLLKLADDYNNRDNTGHYYNNQNDIGIAINCLDWRSRNSFDELTADLPNFVKASQTFGKYIAYSQLPCAYWSAPPIQPKLPFKDIKSPPFLIIGVTKDPATPYIWAKNLASEFPSSVLLTLNGEGHTGHNRGVACIDTKVDGLFLHGELPESGISCVSGGN